jgi:hypothetical protein
MVAILENIVYAGVEECHVSTKPVSAGQYTVSPPFYTTVSYIEEINIARAHVS